MACIPVLKQVLQEALQEVIELAVRRSQITAIRALQAKTELRRCRNVAVRFSTHTKAPGADIDRLDQQAFELRRRQPGQQTERRAVIRIR